VLRSLLEIVSLKLGRYCPTPKAWVLRKRRHRILNKKSLETYLISLWAWQNDKRLTLYDTVCSIGNVFFSFKCVNNLFLYIYLFSLCCHYWCIKLSVSMCLWRTRHRVSGTLSLHQVFIWDHTAWTLSVSMCLWRTRHRVSGTLSLHQVFIWDHTAWTLQTTRRRRSQ